MGRPHRLPVICLGQICVRLTRKCRISVVAAVVAACMATRVGRASLQWELEEMHLYTARLLIPLLRRRDWDSAHLSYLPRAWYEPLWSGRFVSLRL